MREFPAEQIAADRCCADAGYGHQYGERPPTWFLRGRLRMPPTPLRRQVGP